MSTDNNGEQVLLNRSSPGTCDPGLRENRFIQPFFFTEVTFLVTQAAEQTDIESSIAFPQSVILCVRVRALKGKRLELPTPNLVRL